MSKYTVRLALTQIWQPSCVNDTATESYKNPSELMETIIIYDIMGSSDPNLEPDFSGDLSTHHLFISVVILSFLTFLLLCYLIIRTVFIRERSMHEIAMRNNQHVVTSTGDHVIMIPAPAAGLDEAAISGIPAVLVGKCSDDDDGECSICLGVYEEGETVKVLPECRHSFHSHCVDAWLRGRATCPLCRMPLDSCCSKVEMADCS